MTTRSLLIWSSSAPRYPLRSASLKQPPMQYSRRSKEDIPHVAVPCGIIIASTTSNDVRSGPNDRHVTASQVSQQSRQVTVSQHVTAHGKSRCHSTSRKSAMSRAIRAEQSKQQNPLTPTWDAPALKRPFLGIRSASIHGGSSLLWISASATSGEWPRMVDHWSLGISLVLRPTAVCQGTQVFDQPGVVRARAKVEGRLRSRVSGAAASRGLVTHAAHVQAIVQSLAPPRLGQATKQAILGTALPGVNVSPLDRPPDPGRCFRTSQRSTKCP